MPERWHPYACLMRIDRPVGIWLLLLPGLWSICLAADGLRHMTLQHCYYIFLFTVGAVIMRGAGCVINDLWDRDLDKKVARTQNRPLASAAVLPLHALVFLGLLLLIGLVILLQFNAATRILGVLTLPLIILYPLMKRITWWPQAFLGLTFNFGALMGWSAVTGGMALPALLLYAGGIFWTLGYDTVYAHQDREDDALAGIKSTALKFGAHSKIWVGGFYAAGFVLLCAGIILQNGFSFVSALLVLPALHLAWQIRTWNPADHASALSIFKSNTLFGLLVLSGMLW